MQMKLDCLPLELFLLIIDNLDLLSLSTFLSTLPQLAVSVVERLPSVLAPRKKDVSFTLLHASAKLNHATVLELLLSHPRILQSIETKDFTGSTPLHVAVLAQAVDCICILLAAGANVNTRDLTGSSPLETSARIGNNDIISVLLVQHIHTSITSGAPNQPSALEIAAENGNTTILSQLMPVFERHPERSQAALIAAIAVNQIPAVNTLLCHPAVSAFSPDAKGLLPLHHAAIHGAVQIAEILLQTDGVRKHINAQDIYGFTAMHWAGLNGCSKLAILLLDAGADVEVVNDDGVQAGAWVVQIPSFDNNFGFGSIGIASHG